MSIKNMLEGIEKKLEIMNIQIYTTQKLNIQTILINNIFKIKIISKEN